jgi:hypothetical protein
LVVQRLAGRYQGLITLHNTRVLSLQERIIPELERRIFIIL